MQNTALPFKLPKRIPTYVFAFCLAITIFLILLHFKVTLDYEPVAQMVGVMDEQSKALNTSYLDYEEQSAILRSSDFLTTEKASGYTTAPAKVLYVNPSNTLASNE